MTQKLPWWWSDFDIPFFYHHQPPFLPLPKKDTQQILNHSDLYKLKKVLSQPKIGCLEGGGGGGGRLQIKMENYPKRTCYV